MKKIKLLLPILTIGTIGSFAIPMLSSCSHNENTVTIKLETEGHGKILSSTLSIQKGLTLGEAKETIYDALQPDDDYWAYSFECDGKTLEDTEVLTNGMTIKVIFSVELETSQDSFTYQVYSESQKQVNIVSFIGNETRIKVPKQVTINDETYSVYAFKPTNLKGNANIKSLNIGAVNTYSAEYVHSLSSLTRLCVSENTSYTSQGNCILSLDKTELLHGCKNSTIPDSVTKIGENAFRGCTGLKAIDLKNIQTISDRAFQDCTNLTTVENCNQITKLQPYVFSGCTSLKSFDLGNITTVDELAFYKCTGLESVNLRKCTNLSGESFRGCLNLTKFEIDNDNTAYSLADNNALIVDKNGTKLIFGSKDNPNIPETIVDICDGAYYENTGITTFDFKNAKTIGVRSFESCSKLATITNINKIEKIGQYGFYKCTGLSGEISLPSAIEINDHGFCNCSNLESVNLPEITSLSDGIFSYCKKLTTISCEKVNTLNSSILYGTKVTQIKCGNLTYIHSNAFSGTNINYLDFTNMTETTVPEGWHEKAFDPIASQNGTIKFNSSQQSFIDSFKEKYVTGGTKALANWTIVTE